MLLIANPGELANGIGPGHIKAGRDRGYQGDSPIGGMDRQVNITDILEGDRNGNIPNLNCLSHSVAALVFDDLEDG
jgi:hypothetical protein